MSSSAPQAHVRIVYSRYYNIGFFGLERLHPFDSRKYGRAWKLLCQQFGAKLKHHHVAVDRPASEAELRSVHSIKYLASLRDSREIAAALEIPSFRRLPGWLLHWQILSRMRWAVRGSVLAAKAALQCGAAVNLSGGYHHAKPIRGEGFCVFSDIALIVEQLRQEQLLKPEETIAYIDLDAHQGNGVCHQFLIDRSVMIFDMYNRTIYPGGDFLAQSRIDVDIPLPSGCSGAHYLETLRDKLPAFLDSLSNPRLAIYNAGTDVFTGDQLGGLNLSAEDILQRDLFVFQQCRQRHIPVVMLLSGGYSQQSYRLVANTVAQLLSTSADQNQKEK